MADDKGMALDWDGTGKTSDGGDYELLPEGEYGFKVVSFKRERFQGNARMAACPVAAIQMTCTGADGSTYTAFERFRLNTKMLWHITAFFKSCGLIDPDTPEGTDIPMSLFEQCEGRFGSVKVKIRRYEWQGENREANNFTFLAPKRGQVQPQPAQQAIPGTVTPAPYQPPAPQAPGAQAYGAAAPGYGGGSF